MVIVILAVINIFLRSQSFFASPSSNSPESSQNPPAQTDSGSGINLKDIKFNPANTDAQQTSCMHTVQAGERLFRIAIQYNTTVDVILSLNQGNISDPNSIEVGQKIKVCE